MLKLQDADSKLIVELVKCMPEMKREQDRLTLLESADLAELMEKRDIDLSGAPSVAARSIVRELIAFGRPTPEAEALGLLLVSMHPRVGVEQQSQIDDLIERYGMLKPLASPLPPLPLPPSPVALPVPGPLPHFVGDPLAQIDLVELQMLLRAIFHALGPNEPSVYLPLLGAARLNAKQLGYMRERSADPALRLSPLLAHHLWYVDKADYDPLECLLSNVRADHALYGRLESYIQQIGDRLLVARQARLRALRARAALAWLGYERRRPTGAGVLLNQGRHLLTVAALATESRLWGLEVRFRHFDEDYWESVPTLSVERDLADQPMRRSLAAPELALLVLDDTGLPDGAHRELQLSALMHEQLATTAPAAGERLFLWHHPAGRSASLAEATVLPPEPGAGAEQLCYQLDPRADLPGGPLFDSAWHLVGLHLSQTNTFGRGIGLSAATRAELLVI